MNILEKVKTHAEQYYKSDKDFIIESVDAEVWHANYILSDFFEDYVCWKEEKAIQTKLVELHSFYLESHPDCSPLIVMSFIIKYLRFMKDNNLNFIKL